MTAPQRLWDRDVTIFRKTCRVVAETRAGAVITAPYRWPHQTTSVFVYPAPGGNTDKGTGCSNTQTFSLRQSFYRKRMKADQVTVMRWLPRGSNGGSRLRINQIFPASRYGRWNCFVQIRKKWKKNMGNKKQCPMVDCGRFQFEKRTINSDIESAKEHCRKNWLSRVTVKYYTAENKEKAFIGGAEMDNDILSP